MLPSLQNNTGNFLGIAGDRKVIIRHLISLFILALILRLSYMLLAIDNLGMDNFCMAAPDSRVYWIVADEILGSAPLGPYALFRVGPGYGFILAMIRSIFGSNPIFSILFSVVMGALAPTAVYLLAYSIFRKKKVSLLSGLIAAFSYTSVSLSSHVLTDQPYFTIQCVAIMLFIEGLRRGKNRWFIIAGLLTGIAALIRPVGQFWAFLFLVLPFLLPLPDFFANRRKLISKALLTGLIAILITTAWSARNYAVTGHFAFGSNGMLTLRSCMVTQVKTEGNGAEIIRLRDKFEEEDGDRSPEYAEAYGRAKKRLYEAFRAEPGKFVRYYFKNVWDNVKQPNYFPRGEVPSIAVLNDFMLEYAYLINPAITIMALFSLLLLAFEGRWSAFVILGVTFGYFTLIIGLSFWQGSRLHYPAEMAWAILLSYLVSRVASGLCMAARLIGADVVFLKLSSPLTESLAKSDGRRF